MEVTAQSTIDGNVPTSVRYREMAQSILEGFCGAQLVQQGCDAATVRFQPVEVVDGKWTIIGKGDRHE